MCGIVCAFDLKQKTEDLRPQILEMSKTIRHRGPDWSGIFDNDKAILAHERLAIVDPASGKSVAVTLRPIEGPETAGSRLSLAAMRLLGVPLTALVEVDVRRGS